MASHAVEGNSRRGKFKMCRNYQNEYTPCSDVIINYLKKRAEPPPPIGGQLAQIVIKNDTDFCRT